ncbi:NAD(P)-binding domain-containing protein [Geminicoccus roseus]|uniref:NAD(P)-binding domain-containing protein n=1 Tax=Geminicoccus roseus TaxID=404900 RepID=UPI000A04725B|nr:NAD(P)-binding domain-containing protein [Geminicoccus roseus]
MRLAVGLVGNAHGVGAGLVKAELDVVSRSDLPGEPAAPAGTRAVTGERAFFEALEFPRCIVLDLAPGPLVDEVIEAIYPWLEPGDVVLDFTGSYWVDTLRRFRRMRHRSIYHVDVASVGRRKEEHLLVAGDPEGVDIAMPILGSLTPPERLIRSGHAGTAHFGRALGDAVAAAVTQVRGELRQMLEALPLEQDVAAILNALVPERAPPDGRAPWVLDDAVRLEAATPLLAQAIMLERAEQLEQHVLPLTLPRVGPYQDPEEIL